MAAGLGTRTLLPTSPGSVGVDRNRGNYSCGQSGANEKTEVMVHNDRLSTSPPTGTRTAGRLLTFVLLHSVMSEGVTLRAEATAGADSNQPCKLSVTDRQIDVKSERSEIHSGHNRLPPVAPPAETQDDATPCTTSLQYFEVQRLTH